MAYGDRFQELDQNEDPCGYCNSKSCYGCPNAEPEEDEEEEETN
jgi:hypothetical protein